MKRMLLTINDPPFEVLQIMARRQGMSVQMFLKTIIIPQWLQEIGLNPLPEPIRSLVAPDIAEHG